MAKIYCEECDQFFKSEIDLIFHMSIVHEDENSRVILHEESKENNNGPDQRNDNKIA